MTELKPITNQRAREPLKEKATPRIRAFMPINNPLTEPLPHHHTSLARLNHHWKKK